MSSLPTTVVRECLDHIEPHLREPIDVATLASRAGYSPWHFQRLFQALVGDSIASYVRRRRLSEASRRLLRSEARVIEIAFEYRFKSHEAFTRAFKRQFTVSPAEYRALGQDRAQCPAAAPDRESLALDRHIQPAIVIERELRMVGISGRFHRIRTGAYDGALIGGLWSAFSRHRGDVKNQHEDTALGIVRPIPESESADDTEALYTAGMQVPATMGNPDHFAHVELPPATYAVFEHHGV
ncbi:MAG: helix-turn-helix domain-containing protein, partial [Myxococcales bacterium]|nr:helix-turn-helix domain-containing protein [Myxococcales bacterium]